MPPKRKHNNVDVDEDEEGEGEDDVKTYVAQFSNLQHLLSDTRRDTRSQDLKVMTSICVQIV